VRWAIKAQNVRAAEIHKQIVEVYGEGALNEGNVRKWCRLFKDGRTNVHDEEQSGRPSLVMDDLKEKANAKVRGNRRLRISEFHEYILAGQILRSDQETKYIVQDWVQGFDEGIKKLVTRCD
jgi:hypothetical protein